MFTIYADGQLLYSSTSQETHSVLTPACRLNIGNAGSLSFTLLPAHYLYNAIHRMKTIIVARMDGVEIFRGRVLDTSVDLYKQKSVRCEGDLSYLLDSVQGPYAISQTVSAFFAARIAEHNAQVDAAKRFAVGVVNIDEANLTVYFRCLSYQDTKSTMESELLAIYGGYLRTRTVGATTYLDYVKDYGHVSTQKIELGSNIVDLSESISAGEIFTVLLPLGDIIELEVPEGSPPASKVLSIETVNGGSKVLEHAAGIASFGRIVKVVTFGGVEDPAVLMARAQTYLAENYKEPKPRLSITAIDLHLFNASLDLFQVGHVFTVVSTPHGLNTNLTCISIDYDFENVENTALELGTPRRVKSDRPTVPDGADQNGGYFTEDGYYVGGGYESGATPGVGGYDGLDGTGDQSLSESTARNTSGFKNQYGHIKETKDDLTLTAKNIYLKAEELISLEAKRISLLSTYVDDSNIIHSSEILVERDRITAAVSQVETNKLALEGKITVEANRITASVSAMDAMENVLEGKITVEKDRITAAVAEQVNGVAILEGKITVEKNRITTEVTDRTNAVNTLQGKITVEANRITAAVAEQVAGVAVLEGKITVEKNRITTEVTDRTSAINTLQGKITVEKDRITAEVADRTAGFATLSGKIDVTTSNINLEVTNRTNSYNTMSGRISVAESNIELRVTKAGVITDINVAPGTVTINAAKLNVSGIISAGGLAIDGELSALNASFSSLITGNSTANYLRANSVLSTGNVIANGKLITGKVEATSIYAVGAIDAGELRGTNIYGGTIYQGGVSLASLLSGKTSIGAFLDLNTIVTNLRSGTLASHLNATTLTVNGVNVATALAGKLSTSGTAADSSKFGGQVPNYYAIAAHNHSYTYSAINHVHPQSSKTVVTDVTFSRDLGYARNAGNTGMIAVVTAASMTKTTSTIYYYDP